MTKQTESDERQRRRALAISDLEEFIKLIDPRRWLGSIHREIIQWWTRQDAKEHQIVLLPRDHMKSALIAYRAAWEITKNPSIRILYISSTSNLATKQLKFIKDILTSDTYRTYWPEMVDRDEAKREKWTEREISVDHPQRKDDFIRDPTVFTAGLTTNIVGMHCDIAILDDVVVHANAYIEEMREKAKEQYSYLSSIETVDAKEWIVGTRYHPRDLYSDIMSMMIDKYDENGQVVDQEPLFECKEHTVESAGDGTGEFLWPRTQYPDGRWFGFDRETLAKKRSQYLNQVHFRAQYYNDPNDLESSPIQRSLFQYYEPTHLKQEKGRWYLRDEPLNVVASVDFAFSIGKKADYTSIVVIGISGNKDIYILEIDRFKTSKISEYYSHILALHQKWGFRKIRCEVSVAQQVIVNDLKENYIKKHGLALSIDEFRPTRWEGSKEERILATLEPRYANRAIWHYRSGNCQLLEEELIYTNPAHDDIKDALASAIDFSHAPTNHFFRIKKEITSIMQYHPKWGGVA